MTIIILLVLVLIFYFIYTLIMTFKIQFNNIPRIKEKIKKWDIELPKMRKKCDKLKREEKKLSKVFNSKQGKLNKLIFDNDYLKIKINYIKMKINEG